MQQGSRDTLHTVSITKAKEYIFVWGMACYDDGYGKRRTTHFCHRYDTASYNRAVASFNSGFIDPVETIPIITHDKARYHEYGNAAD